MLLYHLQGALLKKFLLLTLLAIGSLYARDGFSSAHGKYVGLKQVLECRHDRHQYGDYYDYGYWEGGPWCGEYGKRGYWVYDYPNWYIWRSKRPHHVHNPYNDHDRYDHGYDYEPSYNSVTVGVTYDTPPKHHINNNTRYINGERYQGRPDGNRNQNDHRPQHNNNYGQNNNHPTNNTSTNYGGNRSTVNSSQPRSTTTTNNHPHNNFGTHTGNVNHTNNSGQNPPNHHNHGKNDKDKTPPPPTRPYNKVN